MNDFDKYIFYCYVNDKKISGKKIISLNESFDREYSDEKLYALAKNKEIPKCSICGNEVKLLKNRTFSVYCGMECQKKHLSKKNKNNNANFNKKKSEIKQKNYNKTLIQAADYYIKNDNMSIRDVAMKFSLPYYTLRTYLNDNNLVDKYRQTKKYKANLKEKFCEVNSFLDDKEWIHSKIQEKKVSKNLSEELGVSKTYITKYLRENGSPYPKTNASHYENIIEEYLKNKNISYVRCNRNILNGLELDFYCEKYKIAIEINGSYYHQTGENFKEKNYHKHKTDLCDSKDIRLIHIFDYDLIYKKDYIFCILDSAFKLNKTIYARNCLIKELNSSEFNSFCKNNHIQGSLNSSYRYGLFYKDDLVAVMGFCKSRYNKNIEYEITRYCSINGYNIVGGASKLYKKFIDRINPNSVISYCNRRFFSGSMYLNIGMEYSHISEPNYVWVSKDLKDIKTRMQTQKHKLQGSGTETEQMIYHKYYKVHDSGQKVFIYRKR